jgi:hypothetical protein
LGSDVADYLGGIDDRTGPFTPIRTFTDVLVVAGACLGVRQTGSIELEHAHTTERSRNQGLILGASFLLGCGRDLGSPLQPSQQPLDMGWGIHTTGHALTDIWGSTDGELFAVGGSTILHFDGHSWLPMRTGSTAALLRRLELDRHEHRNNASPERDVAAL